MEWNPHGANFEVIKGKLCVCRHNHVGPNCDYTELSAEETLALIDHFRRGLAKVAYHERNIADYDELVLCAFRTLTMFEPPPNDKG
jgi:hypothetical protein